MSDLQALVNKLKPSAGINESYIYYDIENGKIHKISGVNRPDDKFSIFPIPTDEVTTILSGERRTEDFIIYYDVSSKQVRLKEAAFDDTYKTADTMCYQLPTIEDITTDNDIVIQQDTNKGEWNIQINPHTRRFLRTSGYNYIETLYFSITSKYDPNILYRSLEFTIGNLIEDDKLVIPFISDREKNIRDVSIYTAKYFDSYVHRII